MGLHWLLALLFALIVEAQNDPYQLGLPGQSSAVCFLHGEPHYTSFDHLNFDWQGICRYKLAGFCGRSRLYPPFSIFSKNEHRLERPAASWPLYVEIQFGSDIVVLGSNPSIITVNGVTQLLPYTPLSASYSVVLNFGYAVFTATSAPLQVSFDGTNSVYVAVGGVYRGAMCGLCGNFDGNSANDWLMPNGVLATNGGQLGDSWVVPETGATDGCPPQRYPPLSQIPFDPRVAAGCNILSDPNGVLALQVRLTSPDDVKLNQNNCLLDGGYSDGTSVKYTLRHVAVTGNVKFVDCADCQLDLKKVLPIFGF